MIKVPLVIPDKNATTAANIVRTMHRQYLYESGVNVLSSLQGMTYCSSRGGISYFPLDLTKELRPWVGCEGFVYTFVAALGQKLGNTSHSCYKTMDPNSKYCFQYPAWMNTHKGMQHQWNVLARLDDYTRMSRQLDRRIAAGSIGSSRDSIPVEILEGNENASEIGCFIVRTRSITENLLIPGSLDDITRENVRRVVSGIYRSSLNEFFSRNFYRNGADTLHGHHYNTFYIANLDRTQRNNLIIRRQGRIHEFDGPF